MAKIKSTKQNSKKDIITRQASQLFRQKGYPATSMRSIADIVGVEAASLYNHIKNKEELLRDICFGVAEAFNTQIAEIESAGDSSLQKIESIIRFHIKMMLENYENVYVSNHDWQHLKEPYLTDFLNQRRNYEKRFSAFIETGVDKNEIKNMSPHVAVLTILSAVRGIEFWHRNKRNVSAADLETNMVEHLLNGIKA